MKIWQVISSSTLVNNEWNASILFKYFRKRDEYVIFVGGITYWALDFILGLNLYLAYTLRSGHLTHL